jgi:hypothetical protein
MLNKRVISKILSGSLLFAVVSLVRTGAMEAVELTGQIQPYSSASTRTTWESPAQLHRGFLRSKARGTLLIADTWVEFRPETGPVLHWSFMDLKTVSIAPRRLEIVTYTNRSLHRPGLRRYRFSLTLPMPPAVAESLTKAILQPSVNTIPDLQLSADVTIPVHHRRSTGGTNGDLRFREDGIDYVTTTSGDSRSWRWADIQTLSHPDPYHLFVFGYRDNYAFDLKGALTRETFNHASDQIWSHNEGQTTITPMPVPVEVPNGRLTEIR